MSDCVCGGYRDANGDHISAKREVERLQDARFMLETEVERLRSHLCPNPYMGVHAEADSQREAEVERLREERNGFFNLTRELETEVERLRGEANTMHAWAKDYLEQRDEAQAEVERLRKLLDEYATAGQNHANEVVRLRAALEQIVEANVSHFHQEPCWENCKYPDCDSDAHEWHTHIGGGSIARAALAKEENDGNA